MTARALHNLDETRNNTRPLNPILHAEKTSPHKSAYPKRSQIRPVRSPIRVHPSWSVCWRRR